MLIEANKIVFKDSPMFHQNFSKQLIYKAITLITETSLIPECKFLMYTLIKKIIYHSENLDDNVDDSIYFV